MSPNVTQQVIVTARHTKTDNVPAHRHEYTERSVEPTERRAAPDGGWGWVVLAAATICLAFTWGQQKAFGIYMIDIMDMLGSNVMHTSTIGGLNTALSYLFAPLASVMDKKYGARRTCIVGGLLAGSGLILGFLTDSLIILCIVIGVINGVGIAIIVIASFSIVNEYFDKRGAMATAICVTGAGVGSLTWPTLTNILVEAYTYQGAFLVTGAAVLNVIVCGLLFRPLTEPRRAVAPSTTATGNQRDDQLNQRVSIVGVDTKMTSRMKSVGQPQSEAGRSEEHFLTLTVPNEEAGSPATLEAQLWGDRERYMEDCVDWSNNDGSQSIGNTGMNGKNGATTPGTAATVTGQRHNAETQENAEGFHHHNTSTDDGPLTFTVHNIYDDAMPIWIDTQLDDCVSSEGGMCPAGKYRRNSLGYVSSPMTVEQRVAHLPVTKTSEYQKPLTEIVSQVLSQQSQDVDNDNPDNGKQCSVPVVYQSVQDPLKLLITADFDRADQRNNMRVGRIEDAVVELALECD
ncbi:PREDICTED: monocarboxylate transporter 5-like [Priapulus caudatus]|uniref:Monocarboxylate transporter 5-like n=1 Tax=Priapulus caudatus TaxID=37621 RepID=A0ABM1F6A1_PRICU|nr:PREDICTED: monocarboxylate transporter 5-like [Priapulus caudatus]